MSDLCDEIARKDAEIATLEDSLESACRGRDILASALSDSQLARRKAETVIAKKDAEIARLEAGTDKLLTIVERYQREHVQRNEDARIARIVREPTDEQARRVGYAAAYEQRETDSLTAVGRYTLGAILALANEAGERERQG